MTPDERLMAVLGEHYVGTNPRTHESTCTCGWIGPMRLGASVDAYRDQMAHLAAVLTDAGLAWRDEAQAEALREAADAMRLASTKGGSHYRAHAWGNWLRARADAEGGA